MRGVNLNAFAFDYDLTWAAFFMNANGKIYGRFGGRDAGSPDRYLTLGGLKYAMRAALESHRREPREAPKREAPPEVLVENYPAAQRLKAGACIHCHQVYDFRRDEKRSAGKWTVDDIWKMLPPDPRKVGLYLEPEQGNRLLAVAPGSPAEKAGIYTRDVIRRINDRPIASYADVQYALHESPPQGSVSIEWEREGRPAKGELGLPDGWRQSDLSWRAFMWGLEPAASVHGKDLSGEEKKALGLSEKALAFRQGQFVPNAARQAGIQKDDIILGIDDKPLEMTMLQFNAYVRLNFKVGDRVTFNVLRDGKRMDLPMALPRRD